MLAVEAHVLITSGRFRTGLAYALNLWHLVVISLVCVKCISGHSTDVKGNLDVQYQVIRRDGVGDGLGIATKSRRIVR